MGADQAVVGARRSATRFISKRQRRIANRVGSQHLPGASAPGSLKIVVHSAISGRPLAAPVLDQRGEGKGTAYFSEEPRVFFMEVTSTEVEWKIGVAERVR